LLDLWIYIICCWNEVDGNVCAAGKEIDVLLQADRILLVKQRHVIHTFLIVNQRLLDKERFVFGVAAVGIFKRMV
jgi:hypothetical protein